MRTIIQLGRYGDIFSLLPLVKEPVNWIIAKGFEDALYGQPGIKVIPLDIAVTDIPQALAHANTLGLKDVVVTQVDKNPSPYGRRDSINFQHEMWIRYTGKPFMDTLPNRMPLVLPHQSNHPNVIQPKTCLCHFKGVSAPFMEAWAMVLKSRLWQAEVEVLDISNLTAPRITDVCAVLKDAKDSGGVLLTVDTSILHMSKAVGIPTFALVNNDKWLAPLTCEHWFGRFPYVSAYSNDGIYYIVESIKAKLSPKPEIVNAH